MKVRYLGSIVLSRLDSCNTRHRGALFSNVSGSTIIRRPLAGVPRYIALNVTSAIRTVVICMYM